MKELINFIFSDKDYVFAAMALIFGIFWVALIFIFRITNRIIRHMNIRRAGWPPPHLDADGDWNEEVTVYSRENRIED